MKRGRRRRHVKSLYEYYAEHEETYYGITYKVENLFTDEIKTSTTECQEFLHKHYIQGQKKELLSIDFFCEYKKSGKHVHSASLYLSGKALMPLFEKHIEDKLKEFVPNYAEWCASETDFLYIWYLPSIYHDFASCIETETIRENDSEQHRKLKFWLGKHDIQYSPYAAFPHKRNKIPFRFLSKLIEKYFYYRACNEQCEHGILAGYMFFDRFVKNFLMNVEKQLDDNGSVIYNGLNWNIGHLTYAAYVADAVICHNIWLGGKAEEDTYKQYGLTPLLYTEHPESKLSIEEYPLQFMLCLLDTIEPTKRFMDSLSPHEILNKIRMEYGSGWLSISWDDVIAQQREFSKWRNGIVNMKDWMCVDVKTGENSVTITFESKMCRS